MTPIPKIEQRWVCIAAAGQTQLAAQLSSYFNDAAVYFPVFQFPNVDKPFEANPGKDDVLTQAFGRRAATWIHNALFRIQPDRIILLGLSEASTSYLRAVFPAGKLLVVRTEADLLALPFTQGKQAPLVCKPSQAIEGLLRAKTQKLPLAFADDAPDLPSRQCNGKTGLIVLENAHDIGEVATINYAMSIDADVAIVPEVKRTEIVTLAGRLRMWANDRSGPGLQEIRRKITSRIKGIDFSKYQFATFFTVGLPYGLILKNIIPFTHVPSGPYCGVFLASSITEANVPMEIGNALLFAIEEFSDAETKDLAGMLDQANFLVTSLIGKDATHNNLHTFGSHLPYDILHITSHGGETMGNFIKQDFEDRTGKTHVVEYYEVKSYSDEAAADPDKARVYAKAIPTALDGVPFVDGPLSKCEPYVAVDMWKAITEHRENLTQTPVAIPIAHSCHIECHESFHQGNFESLAAHSSPIIFNNSCSSSHELAGLFTAAGARIYIGTLWHIGTGTAAKAALAFYTKLLADGNVLEAFTAMLRSIAKEQYRDIYILWGLHFSMLSLPVAKSDDRIIRGLFANYSAWAGKLGGTKDEDMKADILQILRFHQTEIKRRLTPEQLQARIESFAREYAEIERLARQQQAEPQGVVLERKPTVIELPPPSEITANSP